MNSYKSTKPLIRPGSHQVLEYELPPAPARFLVLVSVSSLKCKGNQTLGYFPFLCKEMNVWEKRRGWRLNCHNPSGYFDTTINVICHMSLLWYVLIFIPFNFINLELQNENDYSISFVFFPFSFLYSYLKINYLKASPPDTATNESGL